MADAPEGGTAATGGDAATGTTTGSATSGGGQPAAGTHPGAGDGGKGAARTEAPKTFSQDEVNALLAKERGSTERRFGDYDALQTKAAEFDKLTEAQKSDLQKAQDRASESERRSLQLEEQVADGRMRTAVISAAARKSVVDPDAAFRLLDRAAVTFDKAGEPSNVDALLDDLLKAKPYLSGKPGNGSGEGGPRGGTAPEAGISPNQWFHAQATGRKPQ